MNKKDIVNPDLLSLLRTIPSPDPDGLWVVLGTDDGGEPVEVDLTTTPHLLIAGTTGSGKSTALHVILASLLTRYSPRDVRLLLIDTKRLELGIYDSVPHLRHKVVSNSDEAIPLLMWAVEEIHNRTASLAASGERTPAVTPAMAADFIQSRRVNVDMYRTPLGLVE